MGTKPWWRQVDGRPPDPDWWRRSPLARVGLTCTIIFGGSFLLTALFTDGPAWHWAVLAAPSVVLLAVGIVSSRS